MRIERPDARVLALGVFLIFHAPVLFAQAPPPAPPAVPPAPAAPAVGDGGQKAVFTSDHTVEAGQTLEDAVVVGGDLRVRGRITGDAVVVGGRLILEKGGLVEGDATVTGGSIVERGGRIRGEMRTVESGAEGSGHLSSAGGDEDSDNVIAATRAAGDGRAVRPEGDHRHVRDDDDGWLGSIRDGFEGLISSLAFGLVLAGIGAVLIFYGRPYLETVSDTIRSVTVRSGGVGLAASFLVIPAFLVLVVALVVSLIGIPFLLVAVPAYPLVIASAAGMGLLASAHAIGERTSEQRGAGFDFRYRNSYAYLFTGLGMLLSPLVAASLIQMTGFLGFIGVLLKIVTWIVIWAAATVGFGAVILSRAGTQRTFLTPSPEPPFRSEPFFDDLSPDARPDV